MFKTTEHCHEEILENWEYSVSSIIKFSKKG